VVILEKEEKSGEENISKRQKTWGVFLALVGAMGQGVGIVFAKKGILFHSGSMMHPLSATLIRMLLGALFIWLFAVAFRKIPDLRKALKNKCGMRDTAAGAFIGPFLGVTFSMVAVTYTKAGIAQTLMSLMPVMIIPVIWILNKQKTSLVGMFGAVVAVVGAAILFMI
jgi:drug/metabolite transporter (DMT)-like permease